MRTLFQVAAVPASRCGALLLLGAVLAAAAACGEGQTQSPASAPAVAERAAPGADKAPEAPIETPAPAPVVELVEPPERDLFELARRLRPNPGGTLSRFANPGPVSYREGHTQEFWVLDLHELRSYTVQATLRLASENAYWYVDDAAELDDDDIASAAEAFEGDILPLMTRSFGEVWNPGVDNDPRMTVLHTPLRGVGGYFGSDDEYPDHIHPYSNEREIVYMNSDLRPGSPEYLGTLIHELQHAVHWNNDHGEDAWINEGMAEAARELAGYPSPFVEAFLWRPSTQLNYWPDGPGTSGPHYGAAVLFLAYLVQEHGGHERLRELAAESADGINGVERFLSESGVTFVELFSDWVVANYVDAPEGPYGYRGRDVKVRRVRRLAAGAQRGGSLPQFSAHYYSLPLEGAVVVSFQGEREVAQADTSCHSGRRCWWGNRGDLIDSTLTRELDLTGVSRATLEFRTWFSVEEGWDYAYAEVSTDDGVTWAVLEGGHTSTFNPMGNSFGDGYTGDSDGWLLERIDLSDYAGGKLLLRFEYVTDDAVHLDGFVIDDISVPEAGFFDDAEQPSGWDADGFVRFDNTLPQEYVVQLILTAVDGAASVRKMELDESRAGRLQVPKLGPELLSAVVVVSPVTRGTHRPAPYNLSLSPAN